VARTLAVEGGADRSPVGGAFADELGSVRVRDSPVRPNETHAKRRAHQDFPREKPVELGAARWADGRAEVAGAELVTEDRLSDEA
jgi:hypothetical protein